jgi:excisionase family DNA binding protein
MEDLDSLYRIREVIGFMKTSRATVYRLIKSGQLQSIKSNGTRYVTHSQLLEFVEHLKASQ